MREIKFRYIFRHDKTGHIVSKIYCLDELDTGGSLCLRDMFKEGFSIIAKQQYTGLWDRNKKDIYEGDIVKGDDSTEHDIKNYYEDNNIMLNNDAMIVEIQPPSLWIKGECFGYEGECLITHYHTEVIGNIYENENLLKKEVKKL